ncbi:MAG TPA: hypothetical protein VK105_20375 [Virgibacillus sp.]|nr:hypothetical protein [Virgibacillus sp.]HLR69450.1 hypothetical protein [Virgibacillus sp.]
MNYEKQEYILVKKYLVPSKTKGGLPDIKYEYIANSSLLGFHHDFTKDINKAYEFHENELDHAKMLADAWGMDLEKV